MSMQLSGARLVNSLQGIAGGMEELTLAHSKGSPPAMLASTVLCDVEKETT